jgi:PAS domain-containing protein
MVADLTARIIGIDDERTVIFRMLNFIVLLTSPKRAGFLPVQDGVADDVISIPPGAYPTTEHFRKNFDPEILYMRTEDGGSYRFHVRYDEDLIGILAVDEVSIPEALDEYINLTHFISQIAGLSITIARARHDLERTIAERNDEIAWRKKAELELSLHSQILLNMAEGVALIRTEDGSIAFTNTRFNEMFGYARGELIGQNIAMLNATDTRTPEEVARSIEDELEQRGVGLGDKKYQEGPVRLLVPCHRLYLQPPGVREGLDHCPRGYHGTETGSGCAR